MTGEDEVLLLTAGDVAALLQDRERQVMDTVRGAYLRHAAGATSLPHSSFLYFPHLPRSRIIALPAYLGGEFEVAGLKWVASFPENLTRGLPRASAVLLLNSTASGRPLALLEGSVINAQRTAASAALAARLLHPDPEVARMGMIGCGPIHREVVRYLRVSFPRLSEISICDIAPERAERFRRQAELDHRGLSVRIVPAAQDLLGSVALVSIATTASVPHLFDVASLPDGSTLLHLSVRDLAPEVVLACDNVVDDADHVCREQTSLHLTEQATGGRGFIRCTLADILLGKAPPRAHPGGLTVFTPFGLGVLDVALGKQVYDAAVAAGRGRWVPDFFAAG